MLVIIGRCKIESPSMQQHLSESLANAYSGANAKRCHVIIFVVWLNLDLNNKKIYKIRIELEKSVYETNIPVYLKLY